MTPIRHHDDTTADALMRAVVADPSDLLPRLVLADWMEEHDDRLYAGTPWAEFIRIECGQFGRGKRVRMRAEGLWQEWWYFWCGRTRGFREDVYADTRPFRFRDGPDDARSSVVCVVSNGFVEEVRTTMVWWTGGECATCERGMVRQEEPTYGGSSAQSCSACKGTGRVPGHGAEVVARHPVTRVVVTTPRPRPVLLSGGYRPPSWTRDDLPADVFERVEREDKHFAGVPGSVLHYETDEIAVEALSRVLVDIGRERAGLPKIAWEVSR